MDWKTSRRPWQPCCLVDDKELESDPEPRPDAEPRGNISLDQCLQLFTEPERLSRDEAWYCPRLVRGVRTGLGTIRSMSPCGNILTMCPMT